MNSSKFGGPYFGSMAFRVRQSAHSLLVYNRNFKHIFLEGVQLIVKRKRKMRCSFSQRSTCTANPNAMFKIFKSALSGIRMYKQESNYSSAGFVLFVGFVCLFLRGFCCWWWFGLFCENWTHLPKRKTRVHSLQSVLRNIKTFPQVGWALHFRIHYIYINVGL